MNDATTVVPARPAEAGIALMAVLFALTLLMLLTLPFAVSMNVGADAAARMAEQAITEQDSASVRELLLAQARLSHRGIDASPHYDGLEEFPAGVELPPAFAPMQGEGRVLFGGELVDLQRFAALDGASPLMLANVLGTAARLREDLLPDASSVPLDDASNLPERGYVWIDGEVIGYEQRDGNSLIGLERGLFRDQGFEDGSVAVAAEALVLDYRCALAAAWPFLGRGDGTRQTREPWSSVADLLAIEKAGLGTFTSGEIAALERVFTVGTRPESSATWGRPERVFNELAGGVTRQLQVRSAVHVGAGSTVRVRNLGTGAVEYGVVMSVASQRPGAMAHAMASVFLLDLLMPVTQTFPAIDTVVEPLVPAPVNLNTAPAEVLQAVFENLRRSADLTVPDDTGRREPAPPAVSKQLARELTDEILAARAGPVGGQPEPFTGWQDLVQRVLTARVQNEGNQLAINKWLMLYRNLRTGRDSQLEMGTAPVCFASGPWVRYRAAASRQRSVVAPGVVGRHERTGTAAVVPGFQLEHAWASQQDFENAFVLDRRAPFWITTPINLGHPPDGSLGDEPASRYFPHLVPVAYPSLGLGAPRFPRDDTADAGIEPGVVATRTRRWPGGAGQINAYESFASANHRRGWDVNKGGPYLMNNTGPQGGSVSGNSGGAGAGSAPAATSRRHDQLSFPFSTQGGFMNRFAVGFWAEPATLQNVMLFDHDDGDPDHNRLSLLGRDGNLVLEVLDEAGLDPNPGDSPAGVQRTASRIELPLAELGLPTDTPVHVNFSATSGRPADLSLAVDGQPRGKPQFVTYLTAQIPAFDPQQAGNQTLPGQRGNQRYLDIAVEDTTGFPPVGVLRIGLELFEYSSVNGNAFRCQWSDSTGGRAARQIGREQRPAIPVDSNGVPVVDINDPRFQGVNLDVFPSHPVGAQVELYGYTALLSEDVLARRGETTLSSAIGAFAVARAYVQNPVTISITPLQGPPWTLGWGIDQSWNGDILLADPLPLGKSIQGQQSTPAQEGISNAFSTGGGYALLVQRLLDWSYGPTPAAASNVRAGGIEVIRYGARQGNKLTGVQRAQQLPGNDQQIPNSHYGGAQRFVMDFNNSLLFDPINFPQLTVDEVPTMGTWIIPISIGVNNGSVLADPAQTLLTEWLQLYPKGGDVNDTEWVRYDTIAAGGQVVRANRAAWWDTYFALTQTTSVDRVSITPQGSSAISGPATPPWPSVTVTAGYIGYTPQLENTFPVIAAVRRELRFRGDPFTGTSSHAHSNSTVMPCQRLQLPWGNFGAYTGRVGRHDRVAVIRGSLATGDTRPTPIEWQTVNWQARRYNSDNLAQNVTPSEFLGPWPFQLVAFKEGLRGTYLGPPRGTVVTDSRQFDRVVKFPSGELPAAFCQNPTIGAGVSREQPMRGVVDEVEVTTHIAPDILLEEAMSDGAGSFTVNGSLQVWSGGTLWSQTNVTAPFPNSGGLVQIDGEIIAYQAHGAGTFTVAQNGRGMLGTQPRGHDRGARVMFLTHRPAAILAGGVGAGESSLAVQNVGPLPIAGTVRLGNELLHYTWVGTRSNTLEMPRWYPLAEPGFDRDRSDRTARGLFRGRFGTVPQGASGGSAVVAWPCRYWDRYHEQSDDPELAYFQLTIDEAPVLFRSVRWREETRDARVEVLCRVRTDSLASWDEEPSRTPGLWEFRRSGDQDLRHRINRSASRLEVRFQTVYRPGCLDLITNRAHGWKTSARIEDVRIDYEGESRIFDEQVSAR